MLEWSKCVFREEEWAMGYDYIFWKFSVNLLLFWGFCSGVGPYMRSRAGIFVFNLCAEAWVRQVSLTFFFFLCGHQGPPAAIMDSNVKKKTVFVNNNHATFHLWWKKKMKHIKIFQNVMFRVEVSSNVFSQSLFAYVTISFIIV